MRMLRMRQNKGALVKSFNLLIKSLLDKLIKMCYIIYREKKQHKTLKGGFIYEI